MSSQRPSIERALAAGATTVIYLGVTAIATWGLAWRCFADTDGCRASQTDAVAATLFALGGVITTIVVGRHVWRQPRGIGLAALAAVVCLMVLPSLYWFLDVALPVDRID